MDSKILKSAGAAVAVVAVVCLSCILLVAFLDLIMGPSSPVSLSLVVVVYLLSAPSLGFLLVYFFRKNKGDLTFLNLTALVSAAVVIFYLIMWIYSSLSYSRASSGDISSIIAYLIETLLIELVFFFLPGLVLYFIGAVIGVLAALLVLTSAEEKKRWNIRSGVLVFLLASASVLFVVLILSRLGNIDYGYTGGPTVTGWSKLQPLSASISYDASDQTFSAVFMNAVGTPIKIDSVTVNESISGTMCSVAVQAGQRVANQTVAAGDTLQLEAKCPSARKMRVDFYDMNITVVYDAMSGSISTQHSENGRIQGAADELES